MSFKELISQNNLNRININGYDYDVPAIGQISRVLANGPVERCLIPGRVIPKTKNCYLIPPCLTLSIIR